MQMLNNETDVNQIFNYTCNTILMLVSFNIVSIYTYKTIRLVIHWSWSRSVSVTCFSMSTFFLLHELTQNISFKHLFNSRVKKVTWCQIRWYSSVIIYLWGKYSFTESAAELRTLSWRRLKLFHNSVSDSFSYVKTSLQ